MKIFFFSLTFPQEQKKMKRFWRRQDKKIENPAFQVAALKDVCLSFLQTDEMHYATKNWSKIKHRGEFISEYGFLDFHVWVHKYKPCSFKVLENVIRRGFLKILKKEVKQVKKNLSYLTHCVCEYDQFKIFKWILKSGFKVDVTSMLRHATKRFNSNWVRWAHKNKISFNSDDIYSTAIPLKNNEVIKFLVRHSYGFPMGWLVASFGNLRLLKWLFKKGMELTLAACYHCVTMGDLAMVKFCFTHCPSLQTGKGDDFGKMMWSYVVYYGYLNILRWFKKKGYLPAGTDYESEEQKCLANKISRRDIAYFY